MEEGGQDWAGGVVSDLAQVLEPFLVISLSNKWSNQRTSRTDFHYFTDSKKTKLTVRKRFVKSI